MSTLYHRNEIIIQSVLNCTLMEIQNKDWLLAMRRPTMAVFNGYKKIPNRY